MEKKSQMQAGNGYFYNYYSLGEEYEPLNFIKDVKAADFSNLRTRINEDVDGEMMSIAGAYSIDTIIEQYSDLMEQALFPEDVSITFSGETAVEDDIMISLKPESREVVLISQNPILDIEDIVKKNEYGNSYHIS